MNTQTDRPPAQPSRQPEPSWFDRVASWVATNVVSRAWFFGGCVLLVLLWAPSIFVIPDLDTWQLIINTTTTIVTFLLVALLENTSSRADKAIQAKLNAIAEGLADLMEAQTQDPTMGEDTAELRQAVGLEDRAGSSNKSKGE